MTHRWDYERPINLWESLPFWLRWPLLFLIVCYMLGAVVAFEIGMSKF